MKKNGFTLIELLAVIIVLAIVALIATPIVLNVVEDARKSAAESEAKMIVSGINDYCATQQMRVQMNVSGAAECGTSLTADKIKEAADLGKATVGSATIENNRVKALTVTSNGYTVTVTDFVIGTPVKAS